MPQSRHDERLIQGGMMSDFLDSSEKLNYHKTVFLYLPAGMQ